MQTRPPAQSMSALANHAFVKMNGIGNEIVVVDLRAQPSAITAEDARAIAAPERCALRPVDGALSAARGRHRSFVRIYNNDGSEAGACGNGMRCVASIVFDANRQGRADLRDQGRPDQLLARAGGRHLHRRYGQAALRLAGDSAGRGIPRHPRRSNCRSVRSMRRSCIRRRWSIWATRMRCSGSTILRLRSSKSSGRCSSIIRSFRIARNITLARDQVARSHRHAHLGARRRPDQGLRLGRLRDRPLRRRALGRADRKVRIVAARRRSRHRMARARRSCADDRLRLHSNSKARSIRLLFNASAPA